MNPFEMTIKKLQELGFFQFFLPFILTSTIFYALLRKSKIFGDPKENVIVNGMVSLIAAFMVWASPILLGINIETQLATFFLYSMIGILVVSVCLLLISLLCPPDLPKHLADTFKAGRFWMVILVLGFLVGLIIFASSFLNIFFPSFGIQQISWDWVLSLGVFAGMVITIFFIVR